MIDLEDHDRFEGRLFWQQFGCSMGSPNSGTFCMHADQHDVTGKIKNEVNDYFAIRCGNGKFVVNKNPHLANKIGFVHAILPTAKFIHIIREPRAVVASTKSRFEAAYRGDNYWRIPFKHYWPEAEYPCWYSVPAYSGHSPQDLKSFKKRLFWFDRTSGKGMADYLRRLTKPPEFPDNYLPHLDFRTFLEQFPDQSRYYPGQGFGRIPEAWVKINLNIIEQLKHVQPFNVLTVNYDDFCRDTKRVVSELADFADISNFELNNVPAQLDVSRKDKWKTTLTDPEKRLMMNVFENTAGYSKLVSLLNPGPGGVGRIEGL